MIMKANRNRTIDISVDEGRCYLDRCLKVNQPASLEDILDKTIIGDSFDVMSYLTDSFADLIIVDPPYNLQKKFGSNSFKKISDEEYERYTEKWIRLVKPLLKPDGTIYVCCDWRSSDVIAGVLKKYFIIQNRITWQREKGRGSVKNWKNSMEDIWFATNGSHYTFNVEDVMMRRRVIAPYRTDGKPKDWEETESGNFRNTYPSNFWDDISVPYWSMPENTAHPTQKPEKLLAKLILASSNPGDIVLDPFAGSGSTLTTAKKLSRHYVGIEINEQYCVWAEKRLEMAEDNKTIQGYSDGVFWERNTSSIQKNNSSKK